MVQITINTTPEEREQVIEALKEFVDKTVSVAEVAREADMNPSRVRYVIVDLLDSGRVRRVPTKFYNEHYKRYSYEVIG